MALKDVEQAIRHGIKMIEEYHFLISQHETSTRYAIIDPIIWALGWKTHNPIECEVEYERGNQGRIDYALFNREEEPVILIEAKRADRNAANFEAQLSKYSLGRKKGIGVLTDGQIWHFYDLSKKGKFQTKYSGSVDICQPSVKSTAQFLNKLSKKTWW